MKTQIANLINGSENTIRNLSSEKYTTNPIGFYNGKTNVPALGGTPTATRKTVAIAVAEENPMVMTIKANSIELTLTRHNSTSGKSWYWEAEITAEQYTAITGKGAPTWTHKGAVNIYSIVVNSDCTVMVYASDGKKKGHYEVLGEEFIEII